MTNIDKTPSLMECAGLLLVRTAITGEPIFADTGALPNRHDWEITRSGTLVAAVEITSAQDRQRRSLTAALDKHWKWHEQVLRQPELARRWIVNPHDFCDFAKVRTKLVALLAELEQDAVTELREPEEYRYREHIEPDHAGYYRYVLPQAERLYALGFLDVHAEPSQAETGGEIMAVIGRTGAVAIDDRHLVHLAESTIANPHDHDLRKLANSGAPEGHLVVFIGGSGEITFKGATISSSGATRTLRTRQLPTKQLNLPVGLAGLWFASMQGTGPAATYLTNGGWRLVETETLWDDAEQMFAAAMVTT